MGKILLVLLTAALGHWMIWSALQIRPDGKPGNGSIGQRIRYEQAPDPRRFLELTRRYHFIIGIGFVIVAAATWLISSPLAIMILYLIYAAGINFARAGVENKLMAPLTRSEEDYE